MAVMVGGYNQVGKEPNFGSIANSHIAPRDTSKARFLAPSPESKTLNPEP